MNAVTDGIEVDAMWPALPLVVELDGWAYHRTRHAFQRDRDRADDLTHGDVVDRPARTAARIAQAATATG